MGCRPGPAARRDEVEGPQVHVTGESDIELGRDPAATVARVPRRVFEVVREALASGPVLVHVPRSGYLPWLACQRCRAPARCARCTGPLSRARAGALAQCRWCGHAADPWSCPTCGGTVLRYPVVGSLRTAEEWGRSFPQTSVVSSGGDSVVDEVTEAPAIVIATPGAEPRARSGYSAAVLLDTWLTMGRPELRAGEEALRRWLNIAGLVRSGADGGRVVAVGDPSTPALQALVRWDPEGFAARELAERRSARLPPAARLATLVGKPRRDHRGARRPRSSALRRAARTGGGRRRTGPARDPHGQGARRRHDQGTVRLQAARSTAKAPPVRIHVDPADFA